MNGFANAILSLLLSWIKVIINQFWNLLSSETGEQLVSFLSQNWWIIVLVLCGGGLLIDLIVYMLRWRPDIVWRNRRRKKHEQWDQEYEDAQPEGYHWESYSDPYPDEDVVYRGSRSAGYATAGFQPVRGKRALDVETQRIAPYVTPPAQQMNYAPSVQPAPAKEDTQDFDPVFDEDAPIQWADGDTMVASPAPAAMSPTFGVPQQKPASYFRDVQAGYAPPIPPEQMYAPQVPGPENVGPVHPGLDADSLRKNIGLTPAGALPEDHPAEEEEQVIAINTNPLMETDTQARSQTFFTTLARKARDLMGSGEENKRTIYDLQPPVDMRSGFREPAYPKPLSNKEDESSSNF